MANRRHAGVPLVSGLVCQGARLELFAEHWSHPDRGSPLDWFAFRLTTLARLAVEAGRSLNVDSPYAPAWLVLGDASIPWPPEPASFERSG